MENKVLKPKIRFKGFTDTWEQRKFKDYGSVAMCKRIFKYETSDSGDVPFYKIGTFGNKADAFITNEKYEYYKSKFSFPNKGDILLSASGTIGRIVEYSGEKAYFQDSNIVWLNHNDNIKNSFLKVLYPIVKWDGIEGSTIKRLYNSNFLSTEIHVPKVKEQEKIGVLFEKIDNLITLHQSKYDKLVNVKKALLEKMFPKDGKNVPEIRFKGFTDTWEQHKFSRLANVRRGLTYSPIDISKNGVRVLRSSNIQEDKFIYSEDDVFVNKNAINIDYVKNNDILITSANGSTRLVGKHALISGLPSSSAVHGGFMLLATANENPEFLNASMSSSWYSKFIELFVSGGNGAIGNLSKSDLDEQEILVPSSEEQKKLGQLFKMIDNLITLHQHKLEKLKNMKKSLLNKMFI